MKGKVGQSAEKPIGMLLSACPWLAELIMMCLTVAVCLGFDIAAA